MSDEAYKAFGERGPQGDHGQHGDRGDAGVQGATGATGPAGAQGEPGKDWKLSGWALARLLAFVIVAAASIYAAARTYEIADANRDTLNRVTQETAQRRDQICLSAEREHKRQVDQLGQTYLYLSNLTGEEAASSLNKFIIANLPQTEDQAKTDVAPEFCDEPGAQAEKLYRDTGGKEGAPPTGLPEPDPVIPERPEKVDQMIRALAADKDQG